MLNKFIFPVATIIILCSAGCTMPFGEEEKEDEFLGCSPTDDENKIENTCSVDQNNENDEIKLFETDQMQNNTSTNSVNETQNNSSTNSTNETQNNIGVYEGMNAPNFKSLIHYSNSNEWNEFELYSQFSSSWENTTNNESKWTAIIFISTDCSHCWNSGDDISEFEEKYHEDVNFLILAVNFSSNNNFNATQEEIVAFQEKNDYFGCYSNTKNCNERPGNPHDSPYIDDRNQSIMYDWNVRGTPAQFIIKPNGIIEWNIYQHYSSNGGDGETFEEALQRIFN